MTEILKTNTFLQFVLLFLTTFLACAKVTIQSKACRKYLANFQDTLVYNTMFFAFLAIFLGLIFPQTAPTPLLIFLSFLSAVSNFSFQVLYSLCLITGPVSLTVLVVNFSVFIPTVFSALLFGEKIFTSQFIGMAFLAVSMFLSFSKKEGDKKANKKWLVLTISALLATGIASCIQKYFFRTELADIENASNTFLFLVYVFATVISLFAVFINSKSGKKEKCTFWFSKNLLIYALVIGFIISVFQKLFMVCVECVKGAVLYPTYNGMQAVIMSIIGVLLFKDKLSSKQKLGIIFGIASIALMNINFGTGITFCA